MERQKDVPWSSGSPYFGGIALNPPWKHNIQHRNLISELTTVTFAPFGADLRTPPLYDQSWPSLWRSVSRPTPPPPLRPILAKPQEVGE